MKRLGRSLLIAVALASACAESNGDRQENASPTTKPQTSTTAMATTTTTLAARTEIGVPEPPDAVIVTMDGFEFTPSELRVSGGTLKVAMRNLEEPCPDEVQCPPIFYAHFFAILGPNDTQPMVRSAELFPGQSGVFVVEGLKPGNYRFICTRHAKNEMRGTLEVTA